VSGGAKNYQIMELVATGGTAVLYRAVQTSLDRVVAVKKLHHHLTTDENFTRRFILEAKAAASLDHENIVKIIDFGVEDGTYMMVMEFIEGESVREILDKWRQLPANLAFALVHQICMGLEHAHGKGIVHRDIKPGNIMVTRAGRAKITDFGLAKLAQSQVQQTAANSILGTPLYMSPEQAFGESVDQRSDLFSLGTVLYECLTGHQPFNGESYMGVIQNIIHHNAPHPSKYGVELPPASEGIVLKAMHKNRENRFQSAREFRLAIEKFLGLDALREANDNLKSLLVTDGATVVLPKTERAIVKKRRVKKGIVVAISVMSAAAFAALGYFTAPQSVRGRIAGLAGPSGSRAVAEETVPPEQPAPRDVFAAGLQNALPAAGLIGGDSVGTADASAPPSENSRVTPVTDSSAAAADAEPAVETQPAAPRVEKTVETPIERPAAEPAEKTAAAPAPAKTASSTRTDEPAETPTETVVATARKGWLSVTTEPAAEVYVDGVYAGDTPLPRLEIRSGQHSLECRTPKHDTYRETVTIRAGELSSRNIVLQKLAGRLSLSTTEGAEVYLDGALIGVTPLAGPVELDAGQHQLTIKKAGYHVWNNSIAIDAKQLLPLKITLSPIY
jgi:tRNA A-37 threonylcarbamoyl transferase component Bud32